MSKTENDSLELLEHLTRLDLRPTDNIMRNLVCGESMSPSESRETGEMDFSTRRKPRVTISAQVFLTSIPIHACDFITKVFFEGSGATEKKKKCAKR